MRGTEGGPAAGLPALRQQLRNPLSRRRPGGCESLLAELGRSVHKHLCLPAWKLAVAGGIRQHEGCFMAIFAFPEQCLL